VKTSTSAAAFLLGVIALAGCAADSESSPVEETDDAELVKAGTCAQRRPIQDGWEMLLIESTATKITRTALPAPAKSHYDTVKNREAEAYKSTIAGAATFAVTNAPIDPNGDILGEVVVFNAAGATVAKGYWKDSPQLYWRGRCH
jgi:hypothetical protein